MKTTLSLSLLGAALLLTSGCFTYERRTSTPVVVETTTPVVASERVVTVLPTGYRTRVVRGTTYYYSNDVYYRKTPAGYVVTTRPY